MATIKTVSEMFVECSLKVSNLDNSYMAMSDCCRRHATAAVVMPNGDKMWRCEAHKTWLSIRSRNGGYVREVIVEDVVPV